MAPPCACARRGTAVCAPSRQLRRMSHARETGVRLHTWSPKGRSPADLGGRGAVVLLHGMLGNAHNWFTISNKGDFAPGSALMAVDLRNHGRSDWADSMTYSEMAEDLRRCMEKHGVTEPLILGHSMGGKVAMTLALETPQMVSGLIVADIAPVAYEGGIGHESNSALTAMADLDLTQCKDRRDADALLKDRLPSTSLRQFVLTNLATHPLRWRANVQVMLDSLDTLRSFPTFAGSAFAGPTLFIRGELSDYIRPEHAAAIQQRFPTAEQVAIAGAGHWVHASKPQEFVSATNEWLSRVR
eukprot:TRINITY_DN37334_c0_g1_i1.p1 TRINITY_DN37334_c0_g1~~TRINITY_DN37334_c0_g1_i1.p1  ORF type:complete len:325 (+),score=45.04 TRINITY_DN37334_c0_g1_i1:76-975(+)